MNNPDEGVTLHSATDLINAIKAMLVQMDRPQRKQFLLWVKERRKEYDFRFPQGYQPPKEQVNDTQTVRPAIVDHAGVAISGSVPLVQPVVQPGIVNPQGEVISSQDTDAGATA